MKGTVSGSRAAGKRDLGRGESREIPKASMKTVQRTIRGIPCEFPHVP
jgi:hypothetical protein